MIEIPSTPVKYAAIAISVVAICFTANSIFAPVRPADPLPPPPSVAEIYKSCVTNVVGQFAQQTSDLLYKCDRFDNALLKQQCVNGVFALSPKDLDNQRKISQIAMETCGGILPTLEIPVRK